MPQRPKNRATALCACGGVELEAIGAPITSVACYCADCQEGSRRIEALPSARPVRNSDGGTAYVLYREDRVGCRRGARFLERHKTRENSATNRVVATCCNSAMFVDFDDGRHWVSVYRSRFRGDVPPLEMRICTKFRPEGGGVPDDVRGYSGFPLRFLTKLVAARISMLLHR